MSGDRNIQESAYLQNHKNIVTIVTESPNKYIIIDRMAIKIPNNSSNHHDERVKGTDNDIQHQNSAHPKTSPIDCDGVQLSNAQCYMVPICILEYKEPELYN